MGKFTEGFSTGLKLREQSDQKAEKEAKKQEFSGIMEALASDPTNIDGITNKIKSIDGLEAVSKLAQFNKNMQESKDYESPGVKRKNEAISGLTKEYASKGYSPETLAKYSQEVGGLDIGAFAKATQEEQFSMNNPEQMKMAQSIRKEYNDLDDVKNFLKVRTQYQDMATSLKVGKETGNYLPVDQTLITTFNKILDPQSVVRESEYARTPENMSLINRLYGNMQSYVQGGAKLTDNDRMALVRMVKEVSQNRYSAYKAQRENYGSIATQSRLPSDLILGKDMSEGIDFNTDSQVPSAKIQHGKDPQGKTYTPVYDSGILIGYNSN